jgi:tetratricopeptide (TPR) repeat protein
MKKNFVFVFLGFIIPGNFLFAQVSDSAKTDTKAKKEVAKADRLFSLGAENYGRALQHYLVAFQLHPDNIYISYKIGQCYILTKKSKNRAIHFLERAYFQSSKIDPYVSYYLGLSYHVNQDYIKALEQYRQDKKEPI